ncbi:MAG: hypothetical protein A4E35_01985 [Methanoregula sp. PtaU1.Bin051]|nr:MAG: hypothetical protein A4E35_01985 [Methanoregula sp. PtaU1.Bin051]
MKHIVLIIVLAGLLMLAGPATAAITDVPAGGNVFIGEQGLDITAGLGANNQIAWFPSTAATSSAVPEEVIDVTATKTAFSVDSGVFSSRTGNWYSWAPGLTAGTAAVAFRVSDPYLAIKVEDTDVNVDVTNKWLYRGDEARFRIETNLYTIGQRAGVPGGGAPVTINFQTPTGAIMSSVTNKAGTSNQLTDIPVTTTPFYTGKFWDSGNSRYGPGTFTIWAECNANSMMDNYPAEGKTKSAKVTVLVQERNPLITVGTATTATTTATTVTTAQTTAKVTTTVPVMTITTAEVTTAAPETSASATTAPARTSPTRTPGFGAFLSLTAGIAAAVMFSYHRR